jgi:hypothetical protein
MRYLLPLEFNHKSLREIQISSIHTSLFLQQNTFFSPFDVGAAPHKIYQRQSLFSKSRTWRSSLSMRPLSSSISD